MNNQEIISIIQAFERGEKVAWRHKGGREWTSWNRHNKAAWNFVDYEYQVVREPREFAIFMFDDRREAIVRPWSAGAFVECDGPIPTVIHVREVLP
jgi:hypothetical protein